MTDRIITVPNLTLKVVTGESCYPSEKGFSAITAEISPLDEKLRKELSQAEQNNLAVELRCARLEVTGIIANRITKNNEEVFILVVDHLNYRNIK